MMLNEDGHVINGPISEAHRNAAAEYDFDFFWMH